jgi:hypothetical protein
MDPDQHSFSKLDPDPHSIEKLEPDPRKGNSDSTGNYRYLTTCTNWVFSNIFLLSLNFFCLLYSSFEKRLVRKMSVKIADRQSIHGLSLLQALLQISNPRLGFQFELSIKKIPLGENFEEKQ